MSSRIIGAHAMRWLVVVVCVAAYALPLLAPPSGVLPGTPPAPDAWLLARLFPHVPPAWVFVRLLAVFVAAVLVALMAPADMDGPRTFDPGAAWPQTPNGLGWTVIGVAIVAACGAPWAGSLDAAGQASYLAFLALPAALLWRGHLPRGIGNRSDTVLTVALLVGWAAARWVTDLGSPRIADMVDAWRGWLDILNFATQGKNVLTNLFDPNLPGVGGHLLLLHGMTFFQANLLEVSVRAAQVFQILSIGICGAGIAALAAATMGRGVGPVAAAVFLFSPYVRFATIFPGPFVAGPLYATVIVCCAVAAVYRTSDCALALLGLAIGVGLGFPGVLPVVGVVVPMTAWALRGRWRDAWVGIGVAVVVCVAVVTPMSFEVLRLSDLAHHVRWDGSVSVIDGNLLGQLALRTGAPTPTYAQPRPLDAVIAALLSPFAHPRIGVRLWGDTVYDPLGAVLIAIGLAVALRAAWRSPWARALVLLFFAALSPAFLSPIDVVDIVHAVAFPLPAALMAGLGFAACCRVWAVDPRRVAPIVVAAVAVGGTWIYDVVNPRILSASSFGIMYSGLAPADADRVIVLAYGPDFVRPTKTLFTGPITAFGGPRPVGYLEYNGGPLPSDLEQEGKDLLFWSHGYSLDFDVVGAVCAQWPSATFFELWDPARLGRVHAARIGPREWRPGLPRERWAESRCPTAGATAGAP